MATRSHSARSARPGALADGSRCIAAALEQQQRQLRLTSRRLDEAAVRDVHRARVAARRLRSMLKTFRPLLDERRVRSARADLRALAHALAPVREADVRRDLVMAVLRNQEGQDASSSFSPASKRRVASLLDGARRVARAGLRRQRAQPAWPALLEAIDAGLDFDRLLTDRQISMGLVLRRVERTWREAVREIERGPRGAAELHELRLALKHCRYALESVADVAPGATARLLRRLRAAQDAIGEHRDNELAADWVRSNARSLGAPLVRRLLAALEQREPSLLRDAARCSKRLLPAYRRWRDATRGISRGSKPRRA